MSRELLEAKLAAAVESLRQQGASWWPGTEIAPIAYRRLTSFPRRNGSTGASGDERINDLVKGLRAHFEPDVSCTHINDWRHLASTLRDVFVEPVDDGG